MGPDMPGPDREALEKTAERRGVELEYTDTWGKTHRATEGTLREVLDALGPEPDDTAAFPPTLVVYEDEPYLPLSIPEAQSAGTIKIEFEWENGELEHHWFWMPELSGQR